MIVRGYEGRDTDLSNLEGGLQADRGWEVETCSIVFIVFCTGLIALRFAASRVSRHAYYVEDWLMIPAWILMMGMCATAIWSVQRGGVGRHQALFTDGSPESKATLVSWAQSLFIFEFLYGIIVPLEKTTILLFNLRIFRIHRWFRITIYVLIAYIWMWGIAESTVAITQCSPVAYQWNRFKDKTLKGKCLDQIAYYRWHSLPNLLHDFAMLTLPIPVVWQLQIPVSKKVALVAIFITGSIGCIASCLRIYYFWALDPLSDKTWASIQLVSWTVAEPGVILICACMPPLWPLLRRLPGFRSLSDSSGRTKSTSASRTNPFQHDGGTTSWAAREPEPDSDFIPLNHLEYGNIAYQANSYSPPWDQNTAENQSHTGINVTREIKTTRSPNTIDI